MKKNGCYNRTFKMETVVQDGYIPVIVQQIVYGNHTTYPIYKEVYVPNFVTRPFRMSTDCKYDKRHKDDGCHGCKHQNNS